GDLPVGEPRTQCRGMEFEKRPVKEYVVALHASRHAGKPVDAGAPTERDQHRFDLIVRMLRQCDVLQAMRLSKSRKREIARTACSIFGTFAGRIPRIDAGTMKRNAKQATGRRAMRLEAVRRVLEPVMHMQCLHLTGPSRRGRMQQHRRIGAAAVCNS
ncbi:MAG: hypothetical protein JWQ41_2445, partial [Variovorax sp.]|nr:hypothetical protein [Variovorax sp.]